MNAITIESLGISKEELADRVVQRVAGALLSTVVQGEDDESEISSPFAQAMRDRVKQKIDEAIDEIAGRNVIPNVATYVENLCLQETNKWGEKVGKPVTFTEYLVARAENYLTEEVSYEGKTKGQDNFNWRKAGTRISYMVDRHLQYSIQLAMEQALKDANSVIVGGIEGAVKIKLKEVADQLKVKVSK